MPGSHFSMSAHKNIERRLFSTQGMIDMIVTVCHIADGLIKPLFNLLF